MRVAYETFETATSGWSATNARTSCGSWGNILGGYNTLGGNTTNTKTYSWTAFTHTQARVDLDYIKIDSWDGETASVLLAGTTVWSEQFCFCNHTCGDNGGTCGGSAMCGGSNWAEERKVAVSEIINHTSASLAVGVKATLDQATNDESFGIDNVYVYIR